MKKSLLLIFGLVLTLFSCGNEKANKLQETAEDIRKEASEMAEDVAEEIDNQTKSFEVKVLKDDIPSPRKEMTGSIGDVNITVNYGSSSVKERTVWGELVPYNEVWRTGANEATTIEFSKDVMIEGKALPAGKYGLFTVISEDKWTFIFNSTSDQWGAYEYDESKDVIRVDTTPQMEEKSSETMEFSIDGSDVVLTWDKMSGGFEVQ